MDVLRLYDCFDIFYMFSTKCDEKKIMIIYRVSLFHFVYDKNNLYLFRSSATFECFIDIIFWCENKYIFNSDSLMYIATHQSAEWTPQHVFHSPSNHLLDEKKLNILPNLFFCTGLSSWKRALACYVYSLF